MCWAGRVWGVVLTSNFTDEETQVREVKNILNLYISLQINCMARAINSLTLLLWEQTCGCQGGGGLWKVRLGGWEEQMQAICIEWINNNVLLYSKENYVHYPVINHNENMKKNTHTQTHMHKWITFLYDRN